MSVLHELSRRRIPQSVGVYAAGAWLAIEVAAEVFAAFDIPKSALRLVMLAALAGFPLVMMLSWRYNVTRHGLQRTPGDGGGFGAFAGVVALVTGVVGLILLRAAPRVELDDAAPPATSIAVLAFRNMTGDPQSDYVGDGIAEEILNTLAQLQTLHVAARTSSFSFRDKHVDVPTVAKALNVRHVLEGSVRRDGEHTRVTAQLIDSTSGFHVWSENFDSESAGLLEIQEAIARRIASRLQESLDIEARIEPSGSGGSDNVDAYDLYLLARHHLVQRTEESVRQARRYFERAIQTDPQFAAAHAGLADAWIFAINYGGIDVPDAARNAEPLIHRALALQPNLPEAFASSCLLKFFQGEHASAILACQRAVELRPNSAQYLMWLGNAYSDSGRLADAYPQYRRALELDPLNVVTMLNMAETDVQLLRFEHAAYLLERVKALRPNHLALARFEFLNTFSMGDAARLRAVTAAMQAPVGTQLVAEKRLWQGMAEMLAGDWAATIEFLTPVCGDAEARIDFTLHGHCVSSLVLAHRLSGDMSLAQTLFDAHSRALDQRLDLSSPELQYQRAALYGAIGDTEKAVVLIANGDTDGAFDYPFVRLDPRMADVLRDKRVVPIMHAARTRIDKARAQIASSRQTD